MGLPLSILNNVSFRTFMNDIDPRYRPVCRRDVTRSILPDLEKRCVLKLKEICAKAPYISLTLGCWPDRQTDNARNNLTAFVSIILPGFEDYFDELENEETDAEQANRDGGTEEGDNEAVLDQKESLRTLEINDSIYESILNLSSDDEYLRIPCFSHCLQLVVNDGIKALNVTATAALKKVAILAKLAHTKQWSSACVPIERPVTVMKGPAFKKIQSHRIAKRMAVVILVINIGSVLHDAIVSVYRQYNFYDHSNHTKAYQRFRLLLAKQISEHKHLSTAPVFLAILGDT
ncbi:unnamed protein product [Adineta ricciae]|nr:unnamed protein product [Adineta ricciae]